MAEPRRNGTKHRVWTAPRASCVKGNPCPGIYVEDPLVTLVRNINRLVEKMGKEGISQREFTRRAGVSFSAWMQLVKGRTWPEPGTLRKIASAAGVPVEVLFRR